MKKTIASIAIVIVSLATNALAGVYYVSVDGNSTNNGSQSSPWDSVGTAYSHCCATNDHSLIVIGPGTFSEGTLVLGNAQVSMRGSGEDLTSLLIPLVITDAMAMTSLELADTVSNSAILYVSDVKIYKPPTCPTKIVGMWRWSSSNQVQVTGVSMPDQASSAVPRSFVDAMTNNLDASSIKTGVIPGSMIDVGLARDTELTAATGSLQVAINAKTTIATVSNQFLLKSGDTMSAGYLTLANSPTGSMQAVTKGYADGNARVEYDGIVGWNYPTLFAALKAGATNILVRPGSWYEDWPSAVSITNPTRIRGCGRNVTRLSIRIGAVNLDGGVIINFLNNGCFDLSDMDLCVTNNSNNSMRGFFLIQSPALVRMVSMNLNCYASNNELWFIKTLDGDLASVNVVVDDVTAFMKSQNRVGFIILQRTRPFVSIRNSRIVVDKMGSASYDGNMLSCGVKNSQDGCIYVCNTSFAVTNFPGNGGNFVATYCDGDGSGALDTLVIDNCSVSMNRSVANSRAVWIRNDIRHTAINNSYFVAGNGLLCEILSGGGYSLSNMVVNGVDFDVPTAMNFSTNARPASVVHVDNCTFRGAISNNGCKTKIVLGADSDYMASYQIAASNIPDGTVTSAKLATNAVTTVQLATGAVTAAKLAADVDARYLRKDTNATQTVAGPLTIPQLNVSNNWIVGMPGSTQLIAVNNDSANSVAWSTGTTTQVNHNLGIVGTYLVIVTPRANPGGYYYVSNATTNSFTVTTTGNAFNFDYLIIKK